MADVVDELRDFCQNFFKEKWYHNASGVWNFETYDTSFLIYSYQSRANSSETYIATVTGKMKGVWIN